MRIAVFGGSGFIGSHLIKTLKEIHDVDNFDLELGYDLSKPDVVRAIFETPYDVVINCAAHKRVDESREEPGMYYGNNIAIAENIARFCGDTYIIHLDSYYSSAEDLNAYYRSKQFSSSLIRDYVKNHSIVYLHNVYGEGGNGFKDILHDGMQVNVTDSMGRYIYRKFTPVEDVVLAIVALLVTRDKHFIVPGVKETLLQIVEDAGIQYVGTVYEGVDVLTTERRRF